MRAKQIKNTVYNTQKNIQTKTVNRKHTENRTKYITLLSRSLFSPRSMSGRYAYTYIEVASIGQRNMINIWNSSYRTKNKK